MTTNGTTTIETLTAQLRQELGTAEQQIIVTEQHLRELREQAAFIRGKLALLSQLIITEPVLSGDALGEPGA